MAITQDVVVLNDFGNMRVEERQRTTGAGTSSRYTITLTAEPIIHDFAADKLNKAVPQAIADLIKRQILGITAEASEATQLARKYAGAAFARGESWARTRYGGGRTGPIAPGTASASKLFNDSGRLAKSVVVMQNTEEQGFTINVAANRLNPSTFGAGQFDRMITRLRELVPALRGGIEVLQDPTVNDAIKTAQAEWIYTTAQSGAAGKAKALARAAQLGWQYIAKPILLG